MHEHAPVRSCPGRTGRRTENAPEIRAASRTQTSAPKISSTQMMTTGPARADCMTRSALRAILNKEVG